MQISFVRAAVAALILGLAASSAFAHAASLASGSYAVTVTQGVQVISFTVIVP